MPRTSNADFFVSRYYTHDSGSYTVDSPQPDVNGRIFEFWPDKDSRDNALPEDDENFDVDIHTPQASFEAKFSDFPSETLRMLAAKGLNGLFNQTIDPKQSVDENIDSFQDLYELLKSGALREAGAAAGYVSKFVIDFRRYLELTFAEVKPDKKWTIADAQAAIEKAATKYDEEEFDAWRKSVQADGLFAQAKAERMAAAAQAKLRKQGSQGSTVLAGLLDDSEESETAEETEAA